MKRIILLIAIAVAFASVLTFGGHGESVQLEAQLQRRAETGVPSALIPLPVPLPEPVNLQGSYGDAVRMSVTGAGADYIVVVRVRANADVFLATEFVGNSRSRECRGAEGGVICELSARVRKGTSAIVTLYGLGENTRIDDIRVDIASRREYAAASGEQLFYGFGLLLLLGPVFFWLRRWPGLERGALFAVGMAWVALGGILAVAANIVLALAGYVTIRALAFRWKVPGMSLWAAVSAIALILVLVKFVAPLSSEMFANPGGFWLGLPLGISYFAIRIVDLIFNAHAGTLTAFSLRDYLAFIFMPHTLPAGPIMTYREFQNSHTPTYGVQDFGVGAARMSVGLTKKLLADAFLLPAIFKVMMSFLDGGRGDTPFFVMAMLLANTAYVYLDFSAYCDLAIGAGRAAGYRIPENFNWPLLAGSIRRFWQAWHMTLTHWVMRRVYFPAFLTSRSMPLSMFACMLVIGIWHAANLSWVMWAVHHSAALSAEAKLFPAKPDVAAAGHESRARRPLTYFLGLAFIWLWVSLGHSFTLFSDPGIALRSYGTALSLPLELLRLLRP